MAVVKSTNYLSVANAYGGLYYDFSYTQNSTIYAGFYNMNYVSSPNHFGVAAIEFKIPDPGVSYARTSITFNLSVTPFNYSPHVPIFFSITDKRPDSESIKNYLQAGGTFIEDSGRLCCEYKDYNFGVNSYTKQSIAYTVSGGYYDDARIVPGNTYYLIISAGVYSDSRGCFKISKSDLLNTDTISVTFYENKIVNYNGNAVRSDCTVYNIPSSGSFVEGSTYNFSTTTPSHSDIIDYSAVYGQGNGGNDVSATIRTNTPVSFNNHWTLTPHWSDPAFVHGATNINLAYYTSANPITLYAQWSIGSPVVTPAILPIPSRGSDIVDNYLVTFNANGGSCSTTSTYAKKKLNYSFSHWQRDSDGATFDRNFGFTEATTVSARYNTYSNPEDYYSITLPIPTREGYNFKGWSTDASAKSGVTGDYLPSGNMTLYAIWAFKYTDYTMYLGTEELSGMYLGDEEVRICIPEDML